MAFTKDHPVYDVSTSLHPEWSHNGVRLFVKTRVFIAPKTPSGHQAISNHFDWFEYFVGAARKVSLQAATASSGATVKRYSDGTLALSGGRDMIRPRGTCKLR